MRLFVALPLPDDARERLSALCSGLSGARWVANENLHVTLQFIGEVGRSDAADIDDALSRIRAPAFPLALSGVGMFGSGRRVRALWAGIESQPRLVHLHDKVESAIVRAGLEPERRKFKAHVTLARFRDGARARIGTWMEHNDGFSAGPYPADRFTLFESRLGSEGPHYEPLAEYPLDG